MPGAAVQGRGVRCLAWVWSCPHGSSLAEAQRSGENTSQSCDVPGFLRMCWSAKQLPVVCTAGRAQHPPASSFPSLPPCVV